MKYSVLRRVSGLMFAVFVLVGLGIAQTHAATVVFQHNGAADPTTEGFTYWPFNGVGSTIGLADDSGYSAVQISSLGIQQAWYYDTASIAASALSEGWSLHTVARVVAILQT